MPRCGPRGPEIDLAPPSRSLPQSFSTQRREGTRAYGYLAQARHGNFPRARRLRCKTPRAPFESTKVPSWNALHSGLWLAPMLGLPSPQLAAPSSGLRGTFLTAAARPRLTVAFGAINGPARPFGHLLYVTRSTAIGESRCGDKHAWWKLGSAFERLLSM